MKINLKILGFIIVLGFFTVGWFGYMPSAAIEGRYNTNPDVSKKVMASRNSNDFRAPFEGGVEELTAFSDVIVRGSVCTEPIQKVKEIVLPEHMKAKIGGKNIEEYYTYSTIKVAEVYKGKVAVGEELLFRQAGKAGQDDIETKVDKGLEMVFFLRGGEQTYDHSYHAYRVETGLFKVESSRERSLYASQSQFKTESMSDEIDVAKYDGIDLNILEEDIAASIEATKDLSEQELYKKYIHPDIDFIEDATLFR